MVWGPHPTIYVDQYRIYRKVESGAWEDIEDVDNDVFEYTDTEIYITPPGGQAGAKAYYYVKGVVWDPIEGETSSTNTVEVNLQTGQSEKRSLNNANVSQKSFNLYQNYPNPFNPSTQIDYSIKSAGSVTLKVYNMLGKEVEVLVNESKEPGDYSVAFNAENLPSGIYVYILKAGNFVSTKKLILLK